MTKKRTLTEIFNSVESDKGNFDTRTASWYNKGDSHFYRQASVDYASVYESWFEEELRENASSVVEIGICDPRVPGASLRAWYEYFSNAQIYGLDNFWDHKDLINKYINAFNNDRTKVFYCNQNVKADLNNVFEKITSPDIMIDDGSHWPGSIMLTLSVVFPYVKPGGLYIIEDLQTEQLMKHQYHRYAYDNRQILDAFVSYKQTGFLPRLYMSKEEHQYIIDNVNNIQIEYRGGYAVVCLQKKL